MNGKKQYCGLDLLKFVMAVLVAARHMIQVFYPAESRWRLIIGSWLSNLAVPVFFMIAGFLLFRKIPDTDKKSGWSVVGRYAWRIVKLYLLWCVIYWPIDIFNWYHGTATIMETLKAYVHSFFFSSTIAQLWYLPALAVAVLIVWTGYRAEICDYAKRPVLRKLLPGTGTLVFQKDLAHAGVVFPWRKRGVSGSDVQRGVHLFQYQYGIHRSSGGGLPD